MYPFRLAGDVGVRSFSFQRFLLTAHFRDRRFHFGLIAAMALLVLFSKLHIGDLGGYDDAVYAHEGKTILATGRWWSVYLNGQLDFDKPPMFVWMEAVSMWVFGVTDFAAKFPSALLGFSTILLTFFLAREVSDSYRLPVWAMLILLCTQVFIRFSMRAMTDVPFTFFFVLAVLTYLLGLKRRGYFLLFGLAVACAVLTRSYLGVIPLAITMAHATLTGRWKLFASKSFVAGMLLAVGLPMIWFVSQYRLHGGEFLLRHFSFTVENLPLTGGKDAVQFRSGLFQYPILLFQSYWPWLPLALLGLWMQAKKMFKEWDSNSVLLVIWVLAVIVPFSLIHYKWLRYLMPLFPVFAILAAFPICWWMELRAKLAFPSRHLKFAYVLLGLLLAAMAINPKYRERPEELRRLAPIAQSVTQPEQPILLYTERAPRDAHLFQLIWYADRHGELLDDVGVVVSKVKTAPNSAVIMDKLVFHRSVGKVHSQVKVLAETEGFVCWTIEDVTETTESDAKTLPAFNCEGGN